MTTDPSSIQISSLGQVSIPVVDLDRATAFYRDVLGLEHRFTASGMAFFQCGALRLMLGVADRPEMGPPGSILYYRVDDIQAAHEALAEQGVPFELEPQATHRTEEHELWLAFFRDPEGNVGGLMSEVPVSLSRAAQTS